MTNRSMALLLTLSSDKLQSFPWREMWSRAAPWRGGASVEGQPEALVLRDREADGGKEVVQDQLNHPKPNMSVENIMYQEPMPEGDCNYMEDSKDHHNASHQGCKSKHFCP